LAPSLLIANPVELKIENKQQVTKRNKMKNKWTILAWVAATLIGFSTTVQATSINGSINFTGGFITFDSTTITFAGGSPIVDNTLGNQPLGDYANTGGSTVTWTGNNAGSFVYSPGLSGLSNPLWTFTYNLDNYFFNLSSITTSSYVSGGLPSVTVHGLGWLYIQDASNANLFDPTLGNFTLTSTGSGPTTFAFVAGNNTNVPDGGATVMLLGAALSAMALLRKKLMA
jgi:hypothetical protein